MPEDRIANDARVQGEALRLLAERSRTGFAGYVLAVLVCALATPVLGAAPLPTAAAVAWTVAWAVLRDAASRRLIAAPPEARADLLRPFAAASVAMTGGWSLFAYAILHLYGLDWPGVLALVCALSLAMGTATNFYARPRLVAVLVTILLAPVLVHELQEPHAPAVPAVLLLLIAVFRRQVLFLHREHLQALASTELLRRRGHVLDEARVAAETASEAKSRFLATMSHEIRTPINGMLGMTELALETEMTPEQREYLEAAIRSGQHLLHVVNDILDYSKIEAGMAEVNPGPFSTHDLADQLLTPVRAQAGRKGLRLGGEVAPAVPPCLVADDQRIAQIVVNLLANAVKFTDRGDVTLRLDGEPREGGFRLRITVRDTGPGIPAHQQASIFQPFCQAGDPAARPEGTGLGLAISAQAAELLGGRLAVSSAPGEGSTFTLEVPCRIGAARPTPRPRTAAGPTPAAAPAGARLRVLVAEDNAVNQRLLASFLRKRGHEFALAADGRAALDALAEREFDVVLMDVEMPVLDGIAATRRLRERERQQGVAAPIPVIGLTAHATADVRERCLMAGMDAYLTKPVRLQRLDEVLAGAVLPESVPA